MTTSEIAPGTTPDTSTAATTPSDTTPSDTAAGPPGLPPSPAPSAAVPVEDELPSVLRPETDFTYVHSRHSPRTVRRAGRVLVVVAVLAVLELIGFGAHYLLHTRHFVTTDNAQVDADPIDVNAPSTGVLAGWDVESGLALRTGQDLGQVRGVGGGQQPRRVIRAPGDGTVGLNAVGDGTYVRQGQTLAVGFDLTQVYVTARVHESDIGRVRVGAPVDVRLDAYPGTELSGIVTIIRPAVASEFDIYPSSNVDPTNVQKVDQYVPVRIALYPAAVAVYPGLSATVDIHTD